MADESMPGYPFGDLLALARQSWITQLSSRLAARGYPDYRRSDSAALRLLHRRGPAPVGRLGVALGVSRQAARKVADNLQQRGYATVTRGAQDTRQQLIGLTPAGQDYARAIGAVIGDLNREVASRAGDADLAAAMSVLQAAMFDDSARLRADALLRRAANAAPDGPA
jgi:DNA-binding MarR family transcriptional regulator